ncbi:deoxyribonuclease IV [Metamycoplasma hominis]|uniref:deoxyribonuclease IV n=1 Tax=Metamycoplasma hominis TaxID=2098 RepID=UPI000CD6C430|nr:deoxyribonuclease IV [Metamycoplasma hominis]AUW37062.1 deoxyribonuclease IV [Metamycoplasma hominis]
MIKLGSHISFKKPDYLIGSFNEAINNGENCFMIYLGAPQSAFRVDSSLYNIEKYLKQCNSIIPVSDIVVHAPYIVNLANREKADFGIKFLCSEIKRMNSLGAKLLVLHPGSSVEYSRSEALASLIQSLKKIIESTKDVIICLEIMSGKGSQICSNFNDLLYVIKSVNSERIAICFDTCHAWDAGYDIKDYENFKSYIKQQNILPLIRVIHLNDSMNELGSKKDRHANIDRGHIGLETLKKFVHDKDFDNIPIILETPFINNKSPYKDEIIMLLEDNKKDNILF